MLEAAFLSLNVTGCDLAASIISSHVATESLVILSKYLPYSKVHVLRLQI